MEEVGTSAEEDMEVDNMFASVVLDVEVVAKDEDVEGDFFITHMKLPAGMEHLWQKPMYTL